MGHQLTLQESLGSCPEGWGFLGCRLELRRGCSREPELSEHGGQCVDASWVQF